MSRLRRALVCTVGSLTALALLPLGASPAGAVSEPQTIASGLDNPYKLTFGPDGALYVAEAGTGGDDCVTAQDPEGGGESTLCFGNTGAVTRIGAAQERVVRGLPSVAGETGEEAAGPIDVAFGSDGATYVVTGLGADPAERAMFQGAERMGTLMRVPEGGQTATVFADLGAFETANDPDASYNEESPDSNPFGVEAVAGGGFLVNDAGGNSLLHVSSTGQVSLRTLFPVEEAEAPPFLGLPPGTKIPMQPVPTAVETAPDGSIHVSQLTGFPFPPFEADVFAIADDGGITGSVGGFTNIIDIAYAADGTLYVLEFSSVGLLNAPPLLSQLVQVRTDGTRKVLLNENDLGGPPGGVAVGPDGMVYVTVCNVCGPGAGRVIKVDPSVARDASAAAACPPASVPGTDFGDIALSVHREAVECLTWWDVVAGVTDARYVPERTITRAQAASITAQAMEAAGVLLPSDPPDAFTDDEGSVHERRIDQLAELQVVIGFEDGTYRPDQPVTRAQLVSLLVFAYESTTGEPLGEGGDAFADDEGSVHEANIDSAAAAGWVSGVAPGTFDPGGTAQRGQVASFSARWLATLVAQGDATRPA